MSAMLSPLTQFAAPPTVLPQVASPWESQTPANYGTGTFSGNTPYDKWLYSQNQRLQNMVLPDYPTQYASYMPQAPINSTPTDNTYQQPSTVPSTVTPVSTPASAGLTTFADGSQGYAAGYTGSVIGGGRVDTNGNYITQEPITAEEQLRRNNLTNLQNLVTSGDQAAVLSYMQDHNLDSAFFNDALSYAGSPTAATGRSAENWLISAAQANNSEVPGLSYASPEEIRQFLEWQQNQEGLTGQRIGDTWTQQGITDPFADQRLIDTAQQAIATEKSRQAASVQGYTPAYQSYDTAVQPASPLAQVQAAPAVASPVPAAAAVTQPAPQQTLASMGFGDSSNDHARGGLISMAKKYASGGYVGSMASKYGVY